MVDIRQLRYFIAVADAGSLSSAARNLFVTQPTLTVAMKKLEAELRTPLFRQDRQRYELTDAGSILYAEGSEIVARMAELEARVRQAGTTPQESLRVGVTGLFSLDFMGPISQFIGSHPRVKLTLVQGGSPELQQQVADGEIDLAIACFPVYAKGVHADPLPAQYHSYPVSVVMRASNPLAKREKVCLEDLAQCTFSSLTDNYMLGQVLKEQGGKLGREPRVVFESDSWESILTSIPRLDTVSLLPSALRKLSTVRDLAWVPLQDRIGSFSIGIVTRKGSEHNGAAADFIELIRRS